MATLYVLLAGQTEWTEQGRVDCAAGVPLSPSGAAAVREIAAGLRDRGIAAVYASHNESDRQTAEIAAEELHLSPHYRQDLRELDYGLWQGLQTEEIRRRHGRVYREWEENPASVCPPGGETMHQAQDRISAAVAKILRRHRGKDVLVVLHPLAGGLLKCRLTGAELSAVWQDARAANGYFSLDLERLGGTEEKP